MMMSIGEILYRLLEQPLLKAVKKSDIANHIKTVIELVGVPGLKEEKLVILDIFDFRAELPSDFLLRKTVRSVNGEDKIVLTHNTDEYGQFNKKLFDKKDSGIIYTHKIVNGFIYTDFKEGKVELVYYAYLTDEHGWPMIPRNESLYLAIEYFIKSRHFGILADNNAQFERSYQRAEQQYCWYVAQAKGFFSTPDQVEAQALGEALVRMIPIKENFYTNEKFSGQSERRNAHIW
jgi:hypothetical protein